jgi:hypothetical protein
MPDQQNGGWEQPMIEMYQAPHLGTNDYYQPPLNKMEKIYDLSPQNPIMENIYSNDIQIPDDTHGIAIHQKDDEDRKMSHMSNSNQSFNY